MNGIKLVTKVEWFYIVILLVALGTSAGFFIFLLNGLVFERFLWLHLLLAVALFAFVAYLVNLLRGLSNIEIYNNRFSVQSVFGFIKEDTQLSDIVLWAEAQHGEKNEYNTLIIVTAKQRHKIYSAFCTNYTQAKDLLTAHGTRNEDDARNYLLDRKRRLTVACLAFGVLSWAIACHSYVYREGETDGAGSVLIQDFILTAPELVHHYKSSPYITFNTSKYRYVNFQISGPAYNALFKGRFLKNVHVGDTVRMRINAEDYDDKVAHYPEPTFLNEIRGDYSVQVYSISDTRHIYLDSRDYGMEYEKHNMSTAAFTFALGLICFALAMHKSTSRH